MEENYAAVYNRNRVSWLYAAARSPELSATAVRVGLLFATFFNAEDREVVSPSYEWIMENGHISNRRILARALRELETAGFLVIERMHRYRNHYSMPFTGDETWEP